MSGSCLDLRPLFGLGLVVALLAGCASSPPSKYYQLNPIQTRAAITRDSSFEKAEMIVVGPIHLPDYLDRPQIVTRVGENELRRSEFDRWAGSLDSDVTRVLVEDISNHLPAESFSAVPWTPYLESQMPASYRVEVLVDRFDGRLGDSVQLKAQWAVFAKNRTMLLKREATITAQVGGTSYDALVAAMSSVLERLSRDIAAGIGTLFQNVRTRE